MPAPTYDRLRYYRHDEWTAVLHELAARYPHLLTVESAGTSYEGRDIWAATVSNRATGAAADKPALYVDGQLHAMEAVGASVALHLIHHLVTLHAEEPALLDTCTFYVLPCVNPDGAEQLLTHPGKLDNYTARPWSGIDNGIEPEDLNGDGRVLAMRYPHPAGEWRISEHDSRLMVRRRPDEFGGTYYRVRREGRVATKEPKQSGSGKSLSLSPDINLDFPTELPADSCYSRPQPFTEPETRAIAGFILGHPNICCIVNNHSFGGVVLMPKPEPPMSSRVDQAKLNDAAVYTVIGDLAKEVTGYEPLAVLDPGLPALMTWAWRALGIWSLTPEIWSMYPHVLGRAVTHAELPALMESEDVKVAVLDWAEREIGEAAFAPWAPFDHPDLGKVEIGGFDARWTQFNPPPRYLPEVQDQLTSFFTRIPQLFPRLHIEDAELVDLGDRRFLVRARVVNTGFLPTYLSDAARRLDRARPLRVSVTAGSAVLSSAEIGHLDGRANAGSYAPLLHGSDSPGVTVDIERSVELLVDIPTDADDVTFVVDTTHCGRLRYPLTAAR